MKKILILLLAALPALTFAGGLDQVDAALRAATSSITGDLQTTAILWLSAFVGLQMLITNLGQLKSGADIEAIFGKLVGSLMWFGVCFYILENGPKFIEGVGKQFFDVASSIAGAGGFDASQIINTGAKTAANLVAKINDASGLTDLFMPALLGGLVGVVILATSALIAFKVFLIKVEAMLIVMLAPLSFAFLGLNALKDQGISPFKSLISLIYRLIVLAVILKCMGIMSDNLVRVIGLIDDDSIDGIWSSLFAATTGFVLLGFLAFKSDSLASNLASGSTSLGSGDVAAAAALGGAMGAMAGHAGASMAGAAAGAKPVQSMADMMKNLTSGSGTKISNGGGMGSGGSGGGSPADSMPMASMGDAPQRSETPASESSTPPVRPDTSNSSNLQAVKDFAGTNPGTPKTSKEISDVASTLKPQAVDSGKNAGIAGLDSTSPPPQPQPASTQKTGGSALGNLAADFGEMNKHMANEKSGTSISINTHHSD